jgi:hypothetical protein
VSAQPQPADEIQQVMARIEQETKSETRHPYSQMPLDLCQEWFADDFDAQLRFV